MFLKVRKLVSVLLIVSMIVTSSSFSVLAEGVENIVEQVTTTNVGDDTIHQSDDIVGVTSLSYEEHTTTIKVEGDITNSSNDLEPENGEEDNINPEDVEEPEEDPSTTIATEEETTTIVAESEDESETTAVVESDDETTTTILSSDSYDASTTNQVASEEQTTTIEVSSSALDANQISSKEVVASESEVKEEDYIILEEENKATDSEIDNTNIKLFGEEIATFSESDNGLFGAGSHRHKECGVTEECLHHTEYPSTYIQIPGVSAHTNVVRYDPLMNVDDLYDTFKSDHLYLTQDTTIDDTRKITREVWLCLNGYNLILNGVAYDSSKLYNLHITNCSDDTTSKINFDGVVRNLGDIYGKNGNIELVVGNYPYSWGGFSLEGLTETYMYGIKITMNSEQAELFVFRNGTRDCILTLDNVTIRDGKMNSFFYANTDSKYTIVHLIDSAFENNQIFSYSGPGHSEAVFHNTYKTKMFFWGNNTIKDLNLNNKKLMSNEMDLTVTGGRTIFENISTSANMITIGGDIKIREDSILSFRNNTTTQNSKIFAPTGQLDVEENGSLEFVSNEFTNASGNSGIIIPENNLIQGNLTIKDNNITSTAFGEYVKFDKQLNIGNGIIYIAENKKNGVVDLVNSGIHWGTTNSFIVVENGKTMNPDSVIQGIANEGTIVSNWTSVGGTANWKSVFSYIQSDPNKGIIYDTDDSIKTGDISGSHTVKFRDSNNNPISNLPDRKIQDGGSLGSPIPEVGDSEAFLGWFKNRNDATGELTDPWLDSDVVTSDITLYAKTGHKYRYTLVYDKNDPTVSGSMKNREGLYSGDVITLDPCAYTKNNWKLLYWTENADGTGVRWSNSDNSFVYFPQTEDEIKTIYAKWEYVHKHKECGVKGECVHTTNIANGTSGHTQIIYNELVSADDLVDDTKEPYFYLTSDLTLNNSISLNRDTFICLSGHNLTINSYIYPTGHELIISNCSDDESQIINNHSFSLTTYIYGVNHNIKFYNNSEESLVSLEANDRVIYLCNVDIQASSTETYASDFKIVNAGSVEITLEKISLKNDNRKGPLIEFSSSQYGNVVNIIDCEIDGKNSVPSNKKIFDTGSNQSYATINFSGNNVFNNITTNSGSLIEDFTITVNVLDGQTIFSNSEFESYYVFGVIYKLTIAENANLTFDGIKTLRSAYNYSDNFIVNIPIENSILGELVVTNCICNENYNGIPIPAHAINLSTDAKLNIGSSKILVENNRTSLNKELCGLYADGDRGNNAIIDVAMGKKLNANTKIEYVAFPDNSDKKGCIISNWNYVKNNTYFVDTFTAYNNSNYYTPATQYNGLVVANESDRIVIKEDNVITVIFAADLTEGVKEQIVQLDSKLSLCIPVEESGKHYNDRWEYYEYATNQYGIRTITDAAVWDNAAFESRRVTSEMIEKALAGKLIYSEAYGKLEMKPIMTQILHYTLHYNANGGTGTMPDQTEMIANTDQKLNENLFTRVGYVFLGWCDNQSFANPDQWKMTNHWEDEDQRFNIYVSQDYDNKTIYAVWKQITYALCFDANGGQQSTAPSNITGIPTGESRVIPNTKPTRNNYKFMGWAISKTDDVSYNPGDSYSAVIDPAKFDPVGQETKKTLYAKWEQITYTVTYKKNGGEGADMPISNGKAGENLNLSANTYTKAGYKFRGWDENQNPSDPMHPMYPVTGTMTMNKTMTETSPTTIEVYAIWTQIGYTVTYHKNEGTGTVTGNEPAQMSGYSGVALTLADNSGGDKGNLAMTGKYLLGWATRSNAINATYALGGTMTRIVTEAHDSENVDLYAIWGNVPYNVKLNNNGGTGEPITLPAQSDIDVNLPNNTFTRTNYIFIGWSENASIDPSTFNPADTGNYPVSGGVVNRTVDASQVNTTYNLYAVWLKMTYTLSYDLQGGTDSTGAFGNVTDIGSGDNYTLSSTKPTKANYKFVGWATSSTADPTYQPGNIYNKCLDATTYDPTAADPVETIYAKWEQLVYKVKYNKNSGTGDDMPESDGTSGVDLTLSANSYTKDGYKFLGWDESSTATTPTYSTSAGMTMNKVLSENEQGKSIVVYAIWKQISYTVTYHKNEGTGTVTGNEPVQMTGYSAVALTLADNSGGDKGDLAMNGKYLLGWDESDSVVNPTYSLGGSMTRTVAEANDGENVDLYAIWGNVPYKIKLNNNGGVGDSVEVPAQSDIDANLPANTFTRNGYVFLGWNTDSSATKDNWQTTGEHYSDLGAVNRTVDASQANTTYNLYAVWQRITYTLEYNANGGDTTSIPPQVTNVPSGETRQLSSLRATRENYKFLGWATVSNATVAEYLPSANFSYTVDPSAFDPSAAEPVKSLYAVWKLMTYKVVYDKNTGEGTDMPISNGTSGVVLTLSANSYTKTGYKFLGWDESSTATTPTYPVTAMEMTKTLTESEDEREIKVYAIWKQISFKVIYHENPGTGTVTGATPSQMTGYSDVALTLANNSGAAQGNLSKAGKYLLGWDESAAAINPTYSLGASMTRTVAEANDGEIVNLYAIWGNVPYKVVLKNNGGVGADVELPAQSDIDVNLPANTFTRTNYKFIGWSENANIDPSTFDASAAGNYPTTGGIVNRTVEAAQAGTSYNLFAIWQRYNYTIHYDMNAGGDATNPASIADEVNVKSGENKQLSSVKPTRNNYTFVGWADDASATTAQYQASGNYLASIDSDGITKTIYAVWKYNHPYTVVYHSNGGEGLMEDTIATSGIATPLRTNTFTKSGYTFIGWSENSGAHSASYTTSITKLMNSAGQTVALFAVWRSNGGGYVPSGGSISGGGGSGFTIANDVKIDVDYVVSKLHNPPISGQNFVVSKSYKMNEQYVWRKNANTWSLVDYLTGKYYSGWALVECNGSFDWYHFDLNGIMNTGFYNENGAIYCFEYMDKNIEGRMLTGEQVIQGVKFIIPVNGRIS